MPVKDMTGKRFGRLIALEPTNKRRAHSVVWLCKCSCGNLKEVRQDCLRSGNVRSCGCLMRRLPKGRAAFNELLRVYKRDARHRRLPFRLSRKRFAELTKQACFYCGKEPSQTKHDSKRNGVYLYNGIDRLNSNRGYSTDNCVSCCSQCNRGKRDQPYNNFLSWIKRVCEHSIERK
jgi:hypothetical protein